MSEGAAAVAESRSALMQEAKFSLVELDEEPLNQNDNKGEKQESEEEEDFVVYSEASVLKEANDISHKFESQPTDQVELQEKTEIRPERHEIKLEAATDDDEIPEVSESVRLFPDAHHRTVPQFLNQEEAINSFQDVPLLQSNPDRIFFNGLVFCDTVDSLYRPVVVINTRAIPHKSLRTAALRHLREALEPVVSTGPYVLVFTSFASSTLSTLPMSWVLAAYRELSHPFRKNVQYVILVRPNKFLKAFVKIMQVVVKKKAHSKLKQILYLGDIENVTNGEVTLEHLSPKVIRALGTEELTYSDFSTAL